MTSMDELSAITMMKQGNIKGLEFLVNRYQISAIHSAYLILQDRPLAEDIVSGAFIKSFHKARQILDGRSFRPWFFKIVINDAIKSAKSRQRYVKFESGEDDECKDLADWLIAPESTPEDEVVVKEDIQALRKAIDILSPEERAIVVLRFYLDLSEEEAAIKIRKPLSTVKFRFRNAKKKLGVFMNSVNNLKD
jgi:RNA polymerase sigma-70 factor (ECF subfamily)